MSTLPLYSRSPCTLKVIKDYSYAIDDCIGKGFSSSVYRGRHDPTGDEVAIKVINMKMLKSKSHRDLLNSEVYCLKKTQGCEGVIELKDVFETANNTYIVTELCRGGDLDKYLNSRKLPEKKAIEYMRQIISGYLQLSKRQILHRDLKPANIFISDNELKIADLGFAVKESEKHKNNINVGSPLYMPPESLKHNEYSFKSDIWALGVIFYEMLFGQTPWKANTEKELPRKMMDIPVVKLVGKGSIGNKSLEFLMRTLAPEVKYRMSPEELEKFSFEEKINTSMGSSVLHQYASKYSTNKEKSVGNIIQKKLAVNLSSIQKQNTKERKVGITQSTQQSNCQKYKSNLTPKTETSQQGAQQLTREFLSQIHLCRFIYKIINSLQEVTREIQPLKDNLVRYIYSKLNNIKDMDNSNHFDVEDMDSFRESLECHKIISVSNKYILKYGNEFGHLPKQNNQKLLRKIYDSLSFTIRSIWQKIDDLSPSAIQLFQKHIILVDYLMTTYLLIKLQTRSNLRTFHEKSKIGEIVEQNSHRVTMDHYLAIKEKVKQLGFV